MRRALLAIALLAWSCDTASEGSTGQACPAGVCGSTESTSSATGGACVEQWTCTPWVEGDGGLYTRTCSDDNMCGSALNKPPEGPLELPPLDKNYYMCNVEPIFDRLCSMMGCHGTEEGRLFKLYARGRLRNKQTVPQVYSCPEGPQMLDLQEEGSGTVMCLGWSPHTAEEWELNYNNARAFMIGLDAAADSELLRQPEIGGGFAHAGVHTWSPGERDYQIIHEWLSGATLSSCDPTPN